MARTVNWKGGKKLYGIFPMLTALTALVIYAVADTGSGMSNLKNCVSVSDRLRGL